jgi:hypothetical protein
MTNGTTIDKNEINLRNLTAKAKKDDKTFLYYDNSKSKINSIIRKNQLPGFVIEYLWQSKIYKKELVRNQKNLPKFVREDILENCITGYSQSPWTSILRNFLKLHNPSSADLGVLLATPTHESVVMECWDCMPKECHKLGHDLVLYDVIRKNANSKDGMIHKQIVNIISNVLLTIPDMQKPLLDEILSLSNQFLIRNLLTPVFKITAVNDFTVNYLLSHANKETFKDIIKYAMHRENISDSMMAKIYLAID